MDIRIVDGRLTKDAEVKINKTTGKKFLTFTLANNGYANGAPVTTFFNVISNNDFDVEQSAKFTKGTLVIVSGKSRESMVLKDNKTYLNRNIIAHSIEKGGGSSSNNTTVNTENNTNVTTNVPTCEVPPVQAPTVQAPPTPKPNTFEVQIPQQKQESVVSTVNTTAQPMIDDDLPF